MDTILFLGFAAAYLALSAWGCALTARRRRVDGAAIPLLVVAGLLFDNAVIASGRWIGEGPLLESLNFARFWIHAIVTPLLVIWAWDACRRAGAKWARTRVAGVIAVVVTFALMVLEYVTVLAGLSIEPGTEYGVLSYSSTEAAGPPLMVLFVAAALFGAGIVVWVAQKWPVLFIGTLIMVIGMAAPIPVESGAVTNAFELVLLVSILWTTAHQDRAERRPG
ncbi:hypothetical protein OH146_11900 [Salinibacterium sp. SYSU T00001]|uniref:hypothetical protein n=1 Tax=Homoserinimonas sedimenticola TaxID=2986805 RepID=UPI00223547C7|nr:hypothetical protein [Salinibacterium sedimenticola]MCW4386476.1 hypothetical protein [Salinibacterium sedimenticola]